MCSSIPSGAPFTFLIEQILLLEPIANKTQSFFLTEFFLEKRSVCGVCMCVCV
jgi:hypothetical protein